MNSSIFRIIAFCGSVPFLAAGALARMPEVVDPHAIPNEEIHLEALPNAPSGVTSAILFGDLNKEGLYVLRNKWPANAVMAPHNHGEATRIYTVLEGEAWWGFGDEVDESTMVRLGPGGVVVTRPGMPAHYFRTGPDGVVFNVVAEGPFITNMIGR